MNWSKTLIWAGIVVVGLPVGYFGREYLQQSEDRVQSALNLFRTYCVPFADQQIVPPDKSLVKLEKLPEGTWVDPKSVVLVRYHEGGCAVSDVLQPMTRQERRALDKSVAGLIETELSELRPDNNHGLDTWDEFRLWVQFPRGDKRRWAVTYGRFMSDAEWETSLSLSYPISDEVSEKLRELVNGS